MKMISIYVDFDLNRAVLDMLINETSKNKFKKVVGNDMKKLELIRDVFNKFSLYGLEIKKI